MEDYENTQSSAFQKSKSVAQTSSSSAAEENKTNSNKTFPNEINDYLKTISVDVNKSVNPTLKKEHQRLTDLLSSYNRLTERLQKEIPQSTTQDKSLKAQTSSPKEIVTVLPEIYAVLRPDLYRNFREEEKKRLITKFAKRRTYTQAEKVLPPHTQPPLYILHDRRQNEKDRFCRLVSSAPAGFLNPVENISIHSSKPVRRTPKTATCRVENIREKEKDRLAKIFATGSVRFSKCLPRSSQHSSLNEPNEDVESIGNDGLKLHGAKGVEEADMCKIELAFNQENINPVISSNSQNMVRVGEYSPLNGHHRGKTMLGIGEHDEQQKHLMEERRREYKSLLAKEKNKVDANVNYRNNGNQVQPKPRMSSASTQTDSEDSSTSYQDNQLGDIDSPIHSVGSSPRRRRPMEYSPREKLLSDLYGSPPINHYQAVINEKEKQAAYAEALRAQIEEKKKLEEERKRREKEEEELIEKRVRDQAERLRVEYLKEQNKKFDWMQQRQAQEEVLRRRLVELELESKELKKQERQKKFQKNNEADQNRQMPSPTRKVLQKRLSSQNPVRSGLPKENKSEVHLARSTFTKSPLLEIAPLLDADKQNVLSSKVSELRRGYTDLKEDAGALSLGPGMNLLSSPYVSSDDSIKDNKSSSRSGSRQENVLNRSLVGYVPSIGHLSPRSVYNQQYSWRSPADQLAEQLPHAAHSELFSPSILPESNQQALNRPPSPVIPALQTDMLLKKNSKVLDDKWKVPSGPTNELMRTTITTTSNKRESTPNRNILTQLGEFRRKLAIEHQLLEQRLKRTNS